MMDYDVDLLLPDHDKNPLKLYIENGILPGSFLQAVLSNDLREACGRADYINKQKIVDIVSWLFNEAPASCWGSTVNVVEWNKMGGLNGIAAIQEGQALHGVTE